MEDVIRIKAARRGWCVVAVTVGGETIEAFGLADREPDCAECHEDVYEHTADALRECAAECVGQLRELLVVE